MNYFTSSRKQLWAINILFLLLSIILDEEQEKQEKQEDEIDTTAEERNDGFKPTPTTSSRDIYDTGVIPKYILEKSYRQSKTNTNNDNNDNSNNNEQ